MVRVGNRLSDLVGFFMTREISKPEFLFAGYGWLQHSLHQQMVSPVGLVIYRRQ